MVNDRRPLPPSPFTIYHLLFTTYGFEAHGHLLHPPVSGGGHLPDAAAVVAAVGDGRLGRQLLPRHGRAEDGARGAPARGRFGVGARRRVGRRIAKPRDGL